MKLLTFKPEIKTVKKFPGLIDCEFEHRIASASARMQYLGPWINPEEWEKVLAFFQWTYDTTHSESQVRLFVNTEARSCAFWAFPQEARTGMTAKELPEVPDTKAQRAQFNESEGWVYFGTVHHHCSTSAFQSGTDQANEVGIDGLHITIGNMASTRYDIHARFYLGGFCFEPDLSKFWHIGAELMQQLPHDLWDRVARYQMCSKAQSTTEFPAQWKANLIEVKQTFPVEPTQGWQDRQNQAYLPGANRTMGGAVAPWLRARRALGELCMEALDDPLDEKDQTEMSELIKELAIGTSVQTMILELAEKYDVSISQLWQEVPVDMTLTSCIRTYQTSLTETKTVVVDKQKNQPVDDTNHYGFMG